MRLSTLRYQGGLFGRYGAAAKAHGWNRVRVTSWSQDIKTITDRDYTLADRINTFITAETSFIVEGINIYTIAKRAPT